MVEVSETFTEYGISYQGRAPRRSTWTPDYDVAMRDAAFRDHVHGQEMGPIHVLQRTTVITSTQWEPAARPTVELFPETRV